MTIEPSINLDPISVSIVPSERRKIFGVVGHIDNIEEEFTTPIGNLFVCSIPGEDKKQPYRKYKNGEHIVSEDFVFIGVDGKKVIMIVGDGVTNKGLAGREAAQICYSLIEDRWNSEEAFNVSDLFKLWHQALKESDFPEGSVAIAITVIEPYQFPNAPKIVAKAQFLTCGDVKGSIHTPVSRFADEPYFATKLHRKKSNNKLYKAVNGLQYYAPDESAVLYCHEGDILHSCSDGIEDFAESTKSIMQNKSISFDDLPIHLQGELYLTMLEQKSEHLILTGKIKKREKINLTLFEKYVSSASKEKEVSIHIKALDDMTSVLLQLKKPQDSD